jgi:hypothetical protein
MGSMVEIGVGKASAKGKGGSVTSRRSAKLGGGANRVEA